MFKLFDCESIVDTFLCHLALPSHILSQKKQMLYSSLILNKEYNSISDSDFFIR